MSTIPPSRSPRRSRGAAVLNWFERSVVCLIGLLLLLVAAWLLYFPVKRQKTETIEPAKPSVKTTVEEAEMTNVMVVLIVAGLLFVAFGINRIRITNIVVGGVQAGSDEVEESLDRLTADSEKAIAVLEASPDGEVEEAAPDAAPTKDATKTLKLGRNKYPVYPKEAVPLAVFRDLFYKWPEAAGKLPPDFSWFEYAIRKHGKGNHPWIIKFSDCPPVAFSRGRGGIRVRPLDVAEVGIS